MKKPITLVLAGLISVALFGPQVALLSFSWHGQQARADDKVPLENPKDVAPAAADDKEHVDKEIRSAPDGVQRVRVNDDGSFKSLIVKATVEVEDVLGGQKGKRLGRREAEIECKRLLAKFLSDNCVFAEASDHTTTILTKGESVKDAAGNQVKIQKQEGKEIKIVTENSASVSAACLQGLIVLQSEVTPGGDKAEYVLTMGLSQKTLSQAGAIKAALSNDGKPAAGKAATGQPAKPSAGDDKPAPEVKTNPDIKDF